MKNLLLIPELSGGGIGTYYLEQINAGRFKQEEWDIVCTGTNRIPDNECRLPVLYIDPDPSINAKFNTFWHAFPLIRKLLNDSFSIFEQLKSENYKLVETTDYQWLWIPWVLEAGITKVRVTLHGSNGQIEWYEQRYHQDYQTRFMVFLEQFFLNRAGDKVALSNLNKSWWVQTGVSNIRVIPPFLKLPDLPSINSTNDFLLVIGRVQRWKGAELVADLISRYPDCPRVNWVGGDNYYRDYSQSMIEYLQRKFSITDNRRLTFSGRISRASVFEKLTKAFAVLIPSDWDTFNLAGLEAMALGKIIITSTGAGISEWIEDGKNGFVFSSGSVEALNDVIKKVQVLSESEKQSISNQARETIRHYFSNPDILLAFDEIAPPTDFPADKISAYEMVFGESGSTPAEGLLGSLPVSVLVNHLKSRIFSKITRPKK